MTNISGLSSGGSAGNIAGQLDVQWIVEQLIYAKQQPIRDLEVFESFYEAKKEAFQELNTRASSLESALYKMNNSSFDTKSASVSSEDFFTATASSTASDGEYTVWVDQLAAAQSASSSTVITDPDDQTLSNDTFEIRNYDSSISLGTIDYSSSTMSLNGLRDSINALDLDYSATVINFGTESSPNYKLQMTANKTGVENGFTIIETAAGMADKVAAADAQVFVNIDPATAPSEYITRSSNTISDIISGVTLNLKAADTDSPPDSPTTLTISTDSAGLKENIEEFVNQYNGTMDFLNAHFTYDEEKERAGVLSGEAAAVKVKNDLLSIVSSRVEGLSASDSYSSFAVIGVQLNESGQLEINDSTLDEAIADHLDDVKRVLKDIGTSSHADSRYVGHSDDTVAGTYAVHVDTVAEQALVESAAAISATLGQSENLTITYGGKDYSVALTNGLSDSGVVAAINTAMDDDDVSVYAQINSSTGKLEFLSYDYGASQNVKVVSDVASGGGGTGVGTTQISDSGVDVAGTIDGTAASGSGRVLTSLSGDSKGLKANLSTTNLNDAINGDDKGSITFTRGVGEKLRDRMFEISFPYSGMLSKNIESMESKLQVISDDISDINRRLESEQEILIMQFTRANEAMSQMAYLKSTLSNNFN